MDLDSLAVTHISAGSILQTAAYHTEGFMRGVLTVGSFHIAEGPHGQVCGACALRTPWLPRRCRWQHAARCRPDASQMLALQRCTCRHRD